MQSSKKSILNKHSLFTDKKKLNSKEDLINNRLNQYGDKIIIEIPLNLIEIKPQVRKSFDESKIALLAQDIETKGLIHPITVMKNPNKKNTYILIIGGNRVEAFKKLNKEMYSIKAKNPKKYLVSCGKSYIHFGLKNANTYDLMFGTAVGSFIDYPELRESANKLFTLLQSSFSKASKDSEEVIAFKCITLWSMAHGLVGIIRKVKIAGNLNEDSIGPMSFAGEIANNLDAHLDKVVTGIIEN